MKKTTIGMTCFLAVALYFCGSAAFAGEQLWTFDSAANDWTAANGEWAVNGGVYQEVSGAEAAMHTLVGDEGWTDYVLEARVRIDEGNWAGLVFRAQNEFEYYVYYLNVPDNKTELWKHLPGAFDAREAINSNNPAVNITIANGEWMDVQVVVEGNTFALWVNGEMQVELTDDAYSAGKIGVWGWQTQASFDDVRVSGDSIEGSVTPVEPKAKLTTTWAKIKQK